MMIEGDVWGFALGSPAPKGAGVPSQKGSRGVFSSGSDSPAALRGLANRCRQMADRETDPRLREQLTRMAESYLSQSLADQKREG